MRRRIPTLRPLRRTTLILNLEIHTAIYNPIRETFDAITALNRGSVRRDIMRIVIMSARESVFMSISSSSAIFRIFDVIIPLHGCKISASLLRALDAELAGEAGPDAIPGSGSRTAGVAFVGGRDLFGDAHFEGLADVDGHGAALEVGEEALQGGDAGCYDGEVEHDLRPDSGGDGVPGFVGG